MRSQTKISERPVLILKGKALPCKCCVHSWCWLTLRAVAGSLPHPGTFAQETMWPFVYCRRSILKKASRAHRHNLDGIFLSADSECQRTCLEGSTPSSSLGSPSPLAHWRCQRGGRRPVRSPTSIPHTHAPLEAFALLFHTWPPSQPLQPQSLLPPERLCHRFNTLHQFLIITPEAASVRRQSLQLVNCRRALHPAKASRREQRRTSCRHS